MIVITLFFWMVLGMIIGIPIGCVIVAFYGDSELNDKVRELRKGRYELARAKTRFKIAQTMGMLERSRKK